MNSTYIVTNNWIDPNKIEPEQNVIYYVRVLLDEVDSDYLMNTRGMYHGTYWSSVSRGRPFPSNCKVTGYKTTEPKA